MNKSQASLAPVPLRLTAASKDAHFEQMDAQIWNLLVYPLDKHPSVESLWKVKCSIRCPKIDCEYREVLKKPYVPKDLKTADALYLAPDGKPYFIEFKVQPSQNVDEDDILGKAFESLYAAALSVLGDCPMETIRANAEFLVVFKETSDKTKAYYTRKSDTSFKKVTTPLRKIANLLDNDGAPIYFNLDKFKTAGFYHDVHTFDQGQFEQWATRKGLNAPAEV